MSKVDAARPRLAPPLPIPAPPTPIAVRLARLGRLAVHELDAALAPTRLKPRHIAALVALRNAPQSQADLGLAAHVDPTKLVGLLNDLEAEALVTRRRDPSDRRRHIVAISDLGLARLAAADVAVARVDAALTAGLDDAQRAYLEALLIRIAENAGTPPCPDDDPDAVTEPTGVNAAPTPARTRSTR